MGSDDAINQMQVQREWAGLSVAGIRAEEEGRREIMSSLLVLSLNA